MNKLKVCVYTICKNESKFIERWLNSIKDADYICVLDTGSADDTVDKLKKSDAIWDVKKFDNFRFDIARNESLKLIPNDTDVCICMDIDEVLLPGWRNELEKVWNKDTTRLRYIYNWSLDEFDKPKVSFYQDKIHAYKGYTWINPVHEILKYSGENEIYAQSDNIIINHYPDKEKSRSSYLPLLELSVKENPENDRNVHYLGREYMYYKMWDKSIDMLKKHLQLNSAVWKDERCASMRFIARCYDNLGNFEESQKWLLKAIDEAPHLRDPLVEMAILYYKKNDWDNVIKYGLKALEIPINYKTYINEVFSFDETLDDLLSLAYFNKHDKESAICHAKKALEINPNNSRIKNNLIIMQSSNY